MAPAAYAVSNQDTWSPVSREQLSVAVRFQVGIGRASNFRHHGLGQWKTRCESTISPGFVCFRSTIGSDLLGWGVPLATRSRTFRVEFIDLLKETTCGANPPRVDWQKASVSCAETSRQVVDQSAGAVSEQFLQNKPQTTQSDECRRMRLSLRNQNELWNT